MLTKVVTLVYLFIRCESVDWCGYNTKVYIMRLLSWTSFYLWFQ